MLFIPGIISTLKPGRQLAEYMRDEMPQEQTVYKNFEFTPNLQQNLSSSGLSGEYSYIVEFRDLIKIKQNNLLLCRIC